MADEGSRTHWQIHCFCGSKYTKVARNGIKNVSLDNTLETEIFGETCI